MNRNIFIALLIFIIPLCVYWGLTQDKSLLNLPSNASQGPEIIKFSSPMCYECQELEKIFEEVYPSYSSKIELKKVDVTKKGNSNIIKEYDVKLVPTTVFKDAKGKTVRRIEGSIQPKILENYIKEAING
ncbi:MAG: thioredoxin family protein [bacterium]|nr:thioredoxin family protein [bacterium]